MVAVGRCLLTHWRQLVIILTPLVMLPLPLVIQDDAATVGYLMIVMAIFWVSDVVPLAVTGMIPIFFLPLTGIMKSSEVATEYLKDSTLMFTSALFVASGIEESHLHRRIALNILKLVGVQPNWLMFGFMLPTWFLSMWISNMATTAIMLPIMEAVVSQLEHDIFGGKDQTQESSSLEKASISAIEIEHTNENHVDVEDIELGTVYPDDSGDLCEKRSISSSSNVSEKELKETIVVETLDETSSITSSAALPVYTEPILIGESTTDMIDNMERSGKSFNLETKEKDDVDEDQRVFNSMAKGLTFAVAFSANVGGVATLTGATANVVMKQHLDDLWLEKGMDEESPINYTTWLVMGFPVSVMCFLIIWIWLQLYYLGPRAMCSCFLAKKNPERDRIVKVTIKNEYDKLGSIRYAEVLMALAFVAMVCLWFFRSPGFMTGWGDLSIFKDGYISDTVVSSLVAFILFCIPTLPPICGFEQEKVRGRVRTLLTWDSVSAKFPWYIIFMTGGGFCLAKAATISGLSDWIGEQLTALDVLPNWLMVAILCLAVAMLTEVTCNTATCTIFMPIMAAMAEGLGYNPIYLMLPVAITCSFSFMLPVASVPNAMAFAYGRIRVIDMVQAGAILNFLCVIPVTLAIHTWVYDFFDLGTIPWDTGDINVTAIGAF